MLSQGQKQLHDATRIFFLHRFDKQQGMGEQDVKTQIPGTNI
jgi:hypothetical protein